MKKLHNGQIVDMTSEEIADLENLTSRENAKEQEYQQTKQAKEANQASGNQKLLDLGLTQAEATALTGYTPPVEE